MNKNLFIFIWIFFLYSCAEYKSQNLPVEKEKHYYSSSGFALIYNESLFKNKVINKRINNDEILVMHNILKRNTPIKIINPENSKVIQTKIYKKADFPNIFNAVLSKKIANILELDTNNPYVEIIEIKKNKTYIAKEGNIFDEEKKVAKKAPVSEIKMDDLSNAETIIKKEKTKKKFILVISDFYYLDSANNLKNELNKNNNIKNVSIRKINNNKYRLLVGPFKNFNALKSSIISLNNLGFENLNIYRE